MLINQKNMILTMRLKFQIFGQNLFLNYWFAKNFNNKSILKNKY